MASIDEFNPDMQLAYQYINSTSVSIFLTGKAGTGKTTFLNSLRETTDKRLVVLAPTGVAAINAKGQTIHSFFQLPFGPITPGENSGRRTHYKMSAEKKNLIKSLDVLVIDEISMVRCDLLDAIDRELRKYRDRYKPFGGVQLLLTGDLQQLSPVAKEDEWEILSPFYDTPYFFSSHALKRLDMVTIPLTRIYRQQNAEFLDILSHIRNNTLDGGVLSKLNSRYIPGFEPPQGEQWIRLTTHNRTADQYNSMMLNSLPTNEMVYKCEIEGQFPEHAYPADVDLRLKQGAQVMFIKNDPSGERRYFNGKIGTVVGLTKTYVDVYCPDTDVTIRVTPIEWENVKYTLDERSGEISEKVEGVFRQYPLRTAWAITVHKSQGLTFDRAVLDINRSFAHGQTYVALSRCRTLEGLVLTAPLSKNAVITDMSVEEYVASQLEKSRNAGGRLSLEQVKYEQQLLIELFDFNRVYYELDMLHRKSLEFFGKKIPMIATTIKELMGNIDTRLKKTSVKFLEELQRLLPETHTSPEASARLQERIHSACEYYCNIFDELYKPFLSLPTIETENKLTHKQYKSAYTDFLELSLSRLYILQQIRDAGFSGLKYLSAKSRALCNIPRIKKLPQGIVLKKKPRKST